MKYVSWFIGIIAIIFVVIFGSILLRNAFRTSAARNNAITTGVTQRVKLADYKKSGVTVRMTIEGPVVADENYRQLEVDISNSSRDAKVLGGYKYTVLKETTHDNNQQAFSAFLDALDNSGYTVERATTLKNYSGQCPNGHRYIFDLIENGKIITSLWRSTCTDVAPGTLGSLATPISELFQAQIPDANALISGYDVSF